MTVQQGTTYKIFPDWSEAFSYCREADHPVRVVVFEDQDWKLYKLYPSGRADFIREALPQEYGLQAPPNDPRIFNRSQPDGSYRPLSEFFDREI